MRVTLRHSVPVSRRSDIMKRAFLALGILVALHASRAAASEAWILNIPVRFIANQETGEVRILLELSASPNGSQLVVNGTTVNLGNTAMVAGDSVKFESAGGNNAKITYQPLSNFGVDFCHGQNASEKNIPMRFVGAQDVTAWRISTYIVAAPLSECSQASKHTGDTPAAVLPTDDGVAPALTATFKGRMDFDVVMVLDKSGSMNDLPPVVLTDGMQNTAPLIAVTGSGFLGLAPVAGFPQELRKRFVPLHTIAFGTPAQVDDTLMRAMGLETSGASYQSITATTMFDVFGMTLVSILKGNTVSITARRQDTLTGAGPSTPTSVSVDRSAQRVMFSVQWAPPTRFALDLDVFPPGAVSLATPTSSKKTAQASIQTFDIGRELKPGVWTVRVKHAAKSTEPIDYALTVFFLEKHLDYQFSLDNVHPVAGDKLGIHVLIDWDGKPLTGLPDGAIRARVLRQAEGMGTILHNTRRETPTTNSVTPAGDILTPLDAKIASFKGQSLLGRITPKEVAVIPLKEQGKGIYAATFSDTSVPGAYAFEAILDWDMEKTGHVHREERIEESVKLRADRGKTEIKTTTDASGITTLTVTPRDQFGN